MGQSAKDYSVAELDFDSLVSKAWHYLCDLNEQELFLKICSKSYRETADIMVKTIGCKWNGETFSQLRRRGFLGFTHFYIAKSENLDKEVTATLITFDSHCGELSIPSVISSCWKELI